MAWSYYFTYEMNNKTYEISSDSTGVVIPSEIILNMHVSNDSATVGNIASFSTYYQVAESFNTELIRSSVTIDSTNFSTTLQVKLTPKVLTESAYISYTLNELQSTGTGIVTTIGQLKLYVSTISDFTPSAQISCISNSEINIGDTINETFSVAMVEPSYEIEYNVIGEESHYVSDGSYWLEVVSSGDRKFSETITNYNVEYSYLGKDVLSDSYTGTDTTSIVLKYQDSLTSETTVSTLNNINLEVTDTFDASATLPEQFTITIDLNESNSVDWYLNLENKVYPLETSKYTGDYCLILSFDFEKYLSLTEEELLKIAGVINSYELLMLEDQKLPNWIGSLSGTINSTYGYTGVRFVAGDSLGTIDLYIAQIVYYYYDIVEIDGEDTKKRYSNSIDSNEVYDEIVGEVPIVINVIDSFVPSVTIKDFEDILVIKDTTTEIDLTNYIEEEINPNETSIYYGGEYVYEVVSNDETNIEATLSDSKISIKGLGSTENTVTVSVKYKYPDETYSDTLVTKTLNVTVREFPYADVECVTYNTSVGDEIVYLFNTNIGLTERTLEHYIINQVANPDLADGNTSGKYYFKLTNYYATTTDRFNYEIDDETQAIKVTIQDEVLANKDYGVTTKKLSLMYADDITEETTVIDTVHILRFIFCESNIKALDNTNLIVDLTKDSTTYTYQLEIENNFFELYDGYTGNESFILDTTNLNENVTATIEDNTLTITINGETDLTSFDLQLNLYLDTEFQNINEIIDTITFNIIAFDVETTDYGSLVASDISYDFGTYGTKSVSQEITISNNFLDTSDTTGYYEISLNTDNLGDFATVSITDNTLQVDFDKVGSGTIDLELRLYLNIGDEMAIYLVDSKTITINATSSADYIGTISNYNDISFDFNATTTDTVTQTLAIADNIFDGINYQGNYTFSIDASAVSSFCEASITESGVLTLKMTDKGTGSITINLTINVTSPESYTAIVDTKTINVSATSSFVGSATLVEVDPDTKAVVNDTTTTISIDVSQQDLTKTLMYTISNPVTPDTATSIVTGAYQITLAGNIDTNVATATITEADGYYTVTITGVSKGSTSEDVKLEWNQTFPQAE